MKHPIEEVIEKYGLIHVYFKSTKCGVFEVHAIVYVPLVLRDYIRTHYRVIGEERRLVCFKDKKKEND